MTTHEMDTWKTAESGDEHELTTDVQWFTGSPQTHRVARAITQYGPIARTTLAQLLGLSQGALSRITSDLIYEGVIEELPGDTTEQGRLPQGFIPKESREKRGRPQTNLRLRAADREMGELYGALLDSEDKEFAKAVREAQEAWMRWREAEGRLVARTVNDQALVPYTQRTLEAQMAEDRIKDLRGLAGN